MRSEKQTDWRRGLLIGLCVVLALVLVLMVGLTALMEFGVLGRIGKLETVTRSSEEEQAWLNQTDSHVEDATEMTDMTLDTAPQLLAGENVVNFLLVGQDSRQSGGTGRTDSMILCTFNKTKKTLTMTSFMRDLWVSIPDKYNERLNTAYFLGGFELLNETLETNFGVEIDHNIAIDFFAFAQAVDILGGVDIELNQAEANYLNRWGNWDVDDSTAWTWSLKAGMNHLTGEQALAYSRIRGVSGFYGRDDFGRTGRQRAVLTEFVNLAKEMDIDEAISLVYKLIPKISTDMSSNEIIDYVREILPLLKEIEIVNQRIPADDTYTLAMIQSKSVIVADFDANRKLLEEALEEE